MNRREFFRDSTLATLGGIFAASQPSFYFQAASAFNRAIGLGLFTLFQQMDADVVGTLKRVAAIGYREVESAISTKGPYYGLAPQTFAAINKDLGLTWKSQIVPLTPFMLPPTPGAGGKPSAGPRIPNLQQNLQELVEGAVVGGLTYLVAAPPPTHDLESFKAAIEALNKAAETVRQAGLVLCYHNHDTEFSKIDGVLPYDLLLSRTDASVKMELDLAWAVKGGCDPVALFRQHPGRFPVWHVKDLSQNRQSVEPVGKGTLDFQRIFAHAKLAGLQHVFVEHDMPADPYDSIKTSFRALSRILN